jgi:hypothetical protein
MPAPLFTTNDADITKLEGLYIKERTPPATIAEASLSAVGVFGETLKGPIGEVVRITSEARFIEVFGGGYLNGVRVNDVWTSLLNKGMSEVYVCRVAAAAAAKASFTLEDTAGGGGAAVCRIDASSPGTWGNAIKWRVAAATNGSSDAFNLEIKDTLTGKVTTYENIDLVNGDNSLAVIGDDFGNLITLTKLAAARPNNSAASTDGADADGFTALGQTVAGYTSAAGTDGSVADSDYHGTGKPFNLLASYPGLGVVYCAEYMSANLKSAVLTAAASATDRLFLIGANADSVNEASAISDVASYRNNDGRIVYCYNHVYTLDPETGTEVLVRPESWMAAVLANTDVDTHPGEEDTKRLLAGITRLHRPSIARADYVAFRAAGISALETDLGQPVFVSGVTTSLVSGKTEITRRRMADFLQLSIATTLRYTVKKKNTAARRAANAGMITAFLGDLKKAGRVVEEFSVDTEILNTPTARAQGIERILMRVRLIGHMLHVVLETEIGTSVSVSAA